MGIEKKGKCYSKVNRGQRITSDRYQTPYSMIRQLFTVMNFEPTLSVLEPACGKGSIVRELKNFGFKKITYYDIDQTHPDVKPEYSQFNFLNEKRKFDYIITNPPYRAATTFIEKAATICKYVFAFLMPLNYLHGQYRYDNIFQNEDFPFNLYRVCVFTRMPMLTDKIREDGKYNTGMQVYAWYIFTVNTMYKNDPIIRWIDNNKYVLKKGDKKK